jgi:GntR family transcriptional regulator/MocR family aminotransferase
VLHRQLYDQVRELVLSGRLAPGARLPSSRGLARDLGCGRNTVVMAYDQLLSEGYLEGRHGSGTYVSRVLPEERLTARRPRPARPAPRGVSRGVFRGASRGTSESAAGPGRLSNRGRALAALRPDRPQGSGGQVRAFTPGIPEPGQFPFEVWGRLLGRAWRRPPAALTRHGDPAGHRDLREAIARYLCGVRALRCDWTQVIVTSGAQQGLDLAARLLLDPGEAAWIEQPGYLGLRGPLLAAQARLVPLPVDRDGISVAEGRRRAPAARLAVVTPSHQYPLGVTMSLARRLELLDWAREAGAWIVEDDYDSEFRYAGRPLAALQGLDADRAGDVNAGDMSAGDMSAGGGRVIYLGTFSKILFPSLRLGYLVAPPGLAEPVARARAALDDHPSAVAQPALAAFFEEGHFAAHVRRMRLLYGARRDCLLDVAARHLDGLLVLAPDAAGLHLVARLAPELNARMDDREASARAAAAGLATPALSSYYLEPDSGAAPDAATATAPEQGLLLGYAAVSEPEIEAGIETLARALQ